MQHVLLISRKYSRLLALQDTEEFNRIELDSMGPLSGQVELDVRAGCKCPHLGFFLQSSVCSGSHQKRMYVARIGTNRTCGLTGARPVVSNILRVSSGGFSIISCGAGCFNAEMLPECTLHPQLYKEDLGQFACDVETWMCALFQFTCILNPKDKRNMTVTFAIRV